MQKTILIDGDILVYEMACSVETPIYVVASAIYQKRSTAELKAKSKGLSVTKRRNIGSMNQVRMNLRAKLKTIFENVGSRTYEMYLTASAVKQNFRADIATLLPYKGNRIDLERPFYYEKVRELLVNEYKAIMITGQEADDILGIRQYEIAKQHGNFEFSCIATIDKDLQMIEGNHYHLKKHLLTTVSEEEGLKHFYCQLLKGDCIDNIPGIVKLLKITNRDEEAKKLIYSRPGYLARLEEFKLTHTAQECYNYVKTIYESYGFGSKELLEIGRLLWIRRDYNQLWELPK